MGVAEVLAHRRLGADLECQVGAVDLVVRAVLERDLQSHHRVSGHRTLVQRRAEALLHGRDVLLRHAAADDLVLKLERFLGLLGQDVHHADNVGVLSRPAALLAVTHIELRRPGGRFAIVHLRPADFHRHVVLAANPLDVHLQVQLAHPGDQRLARLLVGRDLQRRILAAESAQGLGQLVGPVPLQR